MNTEILHTYTNEEDGLESYITKGAKGYHVSMKDLDADQFLRMVTIFPDLDAAKSHAKKIIDSQKWAL